MDITNQELNQAIYLLDSSLSFNSEEDLAWKLTQLYDYNWLNACEIANKAWILTYSEKD